MFIDASIDVQFANVYAPKDVITKLIAMGFNPCCHDKVHFLFPSEEDQTNWQEKDFSSFKLETFLNAHPENAKIGLAVAVSDDVVVHAVVYPKWMTIGLSKNCLKLDTPIPIPDFSWYLTKFAPFFQEMNLLGMQCELVY